MISSVGNNVNDARKIVKHARKFPKLFISERRTKTVKTAQKIMNDARKIIIGARKKSEMSN